MSRKGFTLVEVMISIFITTFIIVGVTSLALAVHVREKRSETFSQASNIAEFVMDYIRSRNATYDNNLGFPLSWFGNDENHPLPGLVDIYGNPLSININPAKPNEKYSDKPGAFYFSLQGVVSLGENGYIFDSNPSFEDKNLKTESGKYYALITNNPLVIKFPLTATINGVENPNKIRLFNPDNGYVSKIFVNGVGLTNPSNPNYSPYFTSNKSEKLSTLAYSGYRVHIKIVARKQNANDPNHVQWYDVEVSVYYKLGEDEKVYTLKTKLTTYGEG